MTNKYKIREGILLKVQFSDKHINLGSNYILYIESTIEDYFWKYWQESEYYIPNDTIVYNFMLYDKDIYSINLENYNWKTELLIEDDWKGYICVDEHNSLHFEYTEVYQIIKKLSPFKSKKEIVLLLIELLQVVEKEDYYNDIIFKDYRELYDVLKSRYETLYQKSEEFIKEISNKSKEEVNKIFSKSKYNTEYYKMLYVHYSKKTNVKTYLKKHKNLYALLR